MILPNEDEKLKVSRTGVYGVAIENAQILLVTQARGPFAGKFDLPGGKIEFGETVEQALRREFLEEVNMTFESITLLHNLTALQEVPAQKGKEPYLFHQIGLLYQVQGLRASNLASSELPHSWVALQDLSPGNCSSLLWQLLSIF